VGRRRIVTLGACLGSSLALTASGSAWASAAPTVTRVAPYYGNASGGTEVTIEGSNFEGGEEVRFGSQTVSQIRFASSHQIGVVSPPGVETVDVTVTTAGGTSEISPADQFTYRRFPEYGRCIKGFVGYGEYLKSGCKGGSEVFEDYFWFPAFAPKNPLQKRHFTIVAGEVKLKMAGHKPILCTGGSGAGEYTAGQSTVLSVALSGCHSLTLGKCQSAGAGEGEVRLSPLTGQIGFVHNSLSVGQQLTPASGEVVAEFSCSGTAVTLTGAVIGLIKIPGKMLIAPAWKAALKAGGGQAILNLTGEPEATLQVKFGEGAQEPAGLIATLTQTNEEAVEILAEG
jgi:hypothetical protein